jgi:7-cyano-7-deazaguanine synthase in queuosine biosynthesis
MRNINYKFVFPDISERRETVQIIDIDSNQTIASPKVAIDDSNLFSSAFTYIPSLIADLVDLALAIHFSDRMTPYGNGNSRRITVSLPVRNPEQLTSYSHDLQMLLWWNTLDHWEFNFFLRANRSRTIEIQKYLPLQTGQPLEVALWSGGLDSVAGFLHRQSVSPETSFLLVGTGSNQNAFDAQKKIFESMRQYSPAHIGLIQIPFYWSKTKDVPAKNRYARSRGLVFLLIGAIAAYLQGQNKLCVYENGIGAINLPFNRAAKGIDHTRSVHPRSLLLTADLLSRIMEVEFSIDNPFLFSTKSEMCNALQSYPPDILNSVTTCDRRQRSDFHECGWCSSCLLRRQALWIAEISDPTHYHVPHGLSQGAELLPEKLQYYYAMDKQVCWLEEVLTLSDPWKTLFNSSINTLSFVNHYADWKKIPESDIRSQVIDLYRRHVKEWKLFKPVLRESWFASKALYALSSTPPVATYVQGDLSYAEEHS